MAKLSPFEFIGSINDKKYMMDSETESQYNPFIVNRGLSNFLDALPYVGFLNVHHCLDKKMQYDYLYYGLRKMRRFSKWAKDTRHDYLDDVIGHYKVNKREAAGMIARMTDDQLKELREKINAIGGRGRLRKQ